MTTFTTVHGILAKSKVVLIVSPFTHFHQLPFTLFWFCLGTKFVLFNFVDQLDMLVYINTFMTNLKKGSSFLFSKYHGKAISKKPEI